VFQSYALYPHMDVYRNMAFSLQLRGLPKKESFFTVQRDAMDIGPRHAPRELRRCRCPFHDEIGIA